MMRSRGMAERGSDYTNGKKLPMRERPAHSKIWGWSRGERNKTEQVKAEGRANTLPSRSRRKTREVLKVRKREARLSEEERDDLVATVLFRRRNSREGQNLAIQKGEWGL